MRDVLKPLELLALAAGMGLFTGIIALMSTRDIVIALIGFGIAFIVALVLLAMFALSIAPTDEEKRDIAEQDGPSSPH
jgi:heme A synthase